MANGCGQGKGLDHIEPGETGAIVFAGHNFTFRVPVVAHDPIQVNGESLEFREFQEHPVTATHGQDDRGRVMIDHAGPFPVSGIRETDVAPW